MKTTNEWLDAVKAKHALESDYGLAKLLRIAPQNISHYRSGNRALDPYMAARVAGLLKVDPLKVIASAEAERAKNDEKRTFWRRLAACVVVGTAAATGAPPSAEAGTLQNSNYAGDTGNLYIMRQRRRWLATRPAERFSLLDWLFGYPRQTGALAAL